MTLLFALAAHAACDVPTTNADLVVALEKAADAFGELDRDAFETSLRQAKNTVGCLGQVIDRSAAAELHRVTALSAFLARDEDLAKIRFAAARSIEPAYTFPDTLVPAGNPVHTLYEAFDPTSSPIEQLPDPAQGSLRINGSVASDRPSQLPVVFQRLDDGGAVVSSALVSAGAPVPAYDAAVVKDPEPSTDKNAKKKKSPMVPLLVVAGVLGAGAIGAGVGSQLSNSGYKAHRAAGPTAEQDFDKLSDSKRNTTNTLMLTSAGLGAAAVGTGLVGVISGVF